MSQGLSDNLVSIDVSDVNQQKNNNSGDVALKTYIDEFFQSLSEYEICTADALCLRHLLILRFNDIADKNFVAEIASSVDTKNNLDLIDFMDKIKYDNTVLNMSFNNLINKIKKIDTLLPDLTKQKAQELAQRRRSPLELAQRRRSPLELAQRRHRPQELIKQKHWNGLERRIWSVNK
jgi:hypothetical protein